MSRRRHRTNADRLELTLRIGSLFLGFTLLGALWLVELARGRA